MNAQSAAKFHVGRLEREASVHEGSRAKVTFFNKNDPVFCFCFTDGRQAAVETKRCSKVGCACTDRRQEADPKCVTALELRQRHT